MRSSDLLRELRRLGTAQHRKVLARHGAPAQLLGVSFAHLARLGKRAGRDAALGRALWRSGVPDARLLACLVADPDALASRELDRWAAVLDWYALADHFARHLVLPSQLAKAKAEAWTRRRGEFVARAGWDLVALLAAGAEPIPEAWYRARLAHIERAVHRAPNHARHAMNGALIAIGLRNARLRRAALRAAARIGTVRVDHGETGCRTPDAAACIRRAYGRRTLRR